MYSNISGLLEAVNIHLTLPAYIFTHTHTFWTMLGWLTDFPHQRGCSLPSRSMSSTYCRFTVIFLQRGPNNTCVRDAAFLPTAKTVRKKEKVRKQDTKSKLAVPFYRGCTHDERFTRTKKRVQGKCTVNSVLGCVWCMSQGPKKSIMRKKAVNNS